MSASYGRWDVSRSDFWLPHLAKRVYISFPLAIDGTTLWYLWTTVTLHWSVSGFTTVGSNKYSRKWNICLLENYTTKCCVTNKKLIRYCTWHSDSYCNVVVSAFLRSCKMIGCEDARRAFGEPFITKHNKQHEQRHIIHPHLQRKIARPSQDRVFSHTE